MLFTTTKVVILLSIIYHSWGNVNVALDKPATQSSTQDPYTADRAVNGQTNDFSHTLPDGLGKWWTVDLQARYSIENITLYNRQDRVDLQSRLAMISILTSTVLSPADPNLTHSDWTIRNYREEAYGSSGILSFNPPIIAQHVAVYMENLDVPLTLAVVEIYGVAVNLALNKSSRQNSDNSSAYLAGKAVNGNINDFSQTANNAVNKWWTVDLQSKYSIDTITLYNRQDRVDLQPNLAKIYILTSTLPNPAAPLPGSADWIGQKYRAEAYGSSDTVPFHPPIEALHVAIYLENFHTPLVLAEVQVYGDNNYASGKPAGQATTFQNKTDLAADKAVDGNFTTKSLTDFNLPKNAWWKVDLVDRILLREVIVYGSDGLCNDGTRSCSSWLSDVYFLTNYQATDVAPNTNGTADWSICYHSGTTLRDNYTVQCDTGYQNPVTRLFSIRTNNGIGVSLKEVLVYGYELPELSEYINITAQERTTSSITITFSQWNQQMTGGLPPTQYYIVQGSDGKSKTVVHSTISQTLNTTINGLDEGQTYTFTVSCTIQGIACPGSTPSVEVSTLCLIPEAPGNISQESAAKITHSSRQRWRYAVTWLPPNNVNCGDVLQYSYGLSGQPLSIPQLQRRATFYVDGNAQFVFAVRAENSGGFSGTTTFSGTSDVLKPQFTAGQVSVVGKNSSCVTVTWETPTYPGGTITQYQYQCGSKGRQTPQVGVRSKDSCNYEPNTEILCTVWATNTAGNGSTQNSSKTHCAAPVFTQEPTYTDVYDEVNNKRVVSIIVDTEMININCDTLRDLLYRLKGGVLSADYMFRNLEALTTYEVIIRAVNNKPLSTNKRITITTGETKPDDGPVIAMNRTKYACVFVEWTEPLRSNGVIVEYRYACAKKDAAFIEWTTTEGNSLTDCGYEAGDIVTCDIQASTSIGYGPSTTTEFEEICDKPSSPIFSLMRSSDGNNSAAISITLQTSSPYCQYITEYTINVTHPDGSLVHNQTTTTGGSYMVSNLYGFTNYTVTIEVVNNKGLRSQSTQYVVTVETLPLDGPRLELSFTEDCVLLHLQPPEMPNGEIISYQYFCQAAAGDGRGKLIIPAQDLELGNIPTLCKFGQATKVECNATAVNSVGESPKTTVLGYTYTMVLSSSAPQLLSPKQTNSELVVISIFPVELEDSTLQISSYLVLLRNLTSTEVKRSTEEKCDVGRENCITIAEIDNELVTADGYWFYIADEKLYGGYVNSALVPKSSYSVQIAISVQLPEDEEKFYQTLSHETIFSAPSNYCGPPPAVDNAVASSSTEEEVGKKVVYACEDGYQRLGGDFQLTCTLTNNYEAVWNGTKVVCSKAKSGSCGPPPTVDKAIATSSTADTIGANVRYTCDVGYQRISGDYQLVCVLTDHNEPTWNGAKLVCGKDQTWIVGVSAGIGAFVLLAVGIAIAAVVIKKRKRPPTDSGRKPTVSTELSEYMHPPNPKSSSYAELNFGEEINVSKPVADCEYATIAMDTKPEDERETIPADTSASDHVYDSC